MKEIVLTTINAKWIHPSLALRLLKANLGEMEEQCEIIEFALRQPLAEKIDALSSVRPRILGISVSIWNHAATIELLRSLPRFEGATAPCPAPKARPFPIIVLGGPEVSHLSEEAEIFQYADYVIRGEGEIAFRGLCEKILAGEQTEKFIEAEEVDISQIKSAYHLYTDEDIEKKLIYVEASRGCPFNCEFCLSSLKEKNLHRGTETQRYREFELIFFLAEMDELVKRGVKTFKFLDRTFNANIKRAIQICEYFLEKLKQSLFTVHFEMVPNLFTPELLETLTRFPPESLRLEIGIQTLNPEVAARIGLPGRSGQQADKPHEQVPEPLRFLREKTNAIIRADLIAGLPGEDMASFAKGFDQLYSCLFGSFGADHNPHFEIQLGILKLLPGTPISRHNETFNMRYNPEPPYEILETSVMSAQDIARLKNFARFWEILVNRGLFEPSAYIGEESIFDKFMALSDAVYARFGRNWGIEKEELQAFYMDFW